MLIMPTNLNAQKNEITIETVAKKIEDALDKPSMTKNAVINAFNGLHFNHTQWHTYLADPPEWLKACRVERGYKKIPAIWNPVLIALALLAKGVPENKLDDVFSKLPDWVKEWKAAST